MAQPGLERWHYKTVLLIALAISMPLRSISKKYLARKQRFAGINVKFMKSGSIILKEVIGLSNVLLSKPSEDLKSISLRGGIYLIKRDGKIIYVGKAKNLSRRINSDHISGEIK